MKKLSDFFGEQHREKGRFKPTIPRMVSNKASASPRPSSDSANVSLRERCWTGYRQIGMKKKGDRIVPNCVQEAGAAAIAAATAIAKKKSGNYDKKGFRKTAYKNPDHPNVKSNEQRRKEMNEDFAGDKPQQVAGSAQATLTDKPNKEPMKTYKQKSITELSTELLHRYKEKAAADASKADKEGNFERGNKRFSGVVKATNKQFANFKKKGFKEEAEDTDIHWSKSGKEATHRETGKKTYEYREYKGGKQTGRREYRDAAGKPMGEAVQIDEISAQAHKEYQAKARSDVKALAKHTGGEYGDIAKNIMQRRMKGLSTSTALQARDRMAKINKEETEMNEAKDVREYDYEGDMAKTQLKTIIRNAQKIHDMIDDNENMPEWVQSKITLAKDYIVVSANYLESQMNEEVEQIDEKNVPTSPEKWAQAKAQAKAKFDVYPSAYANGWAAKKYKAMGGGWKSVSEETKPPFEGGSKPKQKAIAGKYGQGYSTARHLARMAMQKQVEKMKKAPIKEESRKAAIVKDVMKKKKTASEDAFQKDPELSSTLTKL